MTSVLWNELTFGIYMALSGILAWNIIFISSSRTERLVGYLLFGISAIGTFASFTRTSWVVILSGCIVFFLLENKVVVRKLFRVLVASAIFIGTVFNIPLPTGHFRSAQEAAIGHIEAVFIYEEARLSNFKVNLERIASFPIGYGLGTAGYSALPTRETESVAAFKDYVAADNNYLSMILQVGIQGLLMFLLIQGLVLRQIVISYKNCDGQARVILGTAVGWIVGMMIGALFLNVWEYNLVPYIVFALMGAALRITRMHR
ncbi:MAG: O-antigen ligase family protein [Candidatus Bathyarchaeia archaeon]